MKVDKKTLIKNLHDNDYITRTIAVRDIMIYVEHLEQRNRELIGLNDMDFARFLKELEQEMSNALDDRGLEYIGMEMSNVKDGDTIMMHVLNISIGGGLRGNEKRPVAIPASDRYTYEEIEDVIRRLIASI